MIIAALAFLTLTACDSEDSYGGNATPTVPVTITSPTLTPEGEGGAAGEAAVSVENVILACREKNRDRLRQFVAEGIRSRITDEEIERLFGRGSDVQLVRQSQETHVEDGRGTATVTVRLRVQRDGEMETVERTWELEREADGVWRFTELPECF